MKPFSVTTTGHGSELVLGFAGSMSEKAVLPDISSQAIRRLVLDFNDVDFINSTGIQLFVAWIHTIATARPEVSITYRRCPRVIVETMNRIRGFLPERAEVESVYFGYYCDKCALEREGLVDLDKLKLNPDYLEKLPPPACEQTDCQLELDTAESRYLLFLRR